MEKNCPFLLMVCLCCGTGFPMFAQGNPELLVKVKPLHLTELQNKIKPLYQSGVQDPLEVQDSLGNQKNVDAQSKETSRHIVESYDSTGLQNRGGFQKQIGSQSRSGVSDSTTLQNHAGESQIGEEPQEKAKIKFVANQLIIENLPEDGLLEIYNIMGVKVYNGRVNAGTSQHFLSLSKGYYIIKIGKLTRKIAVK